MRDSYRHTGQARRLPSHRLTFAHSSRAIPSAYPWNRNRPKDRKLEGSQATPEVGIRRPFYRNNSGIGGCFLISYMLEKQPGYCAVFSNSRTGNTNGEKGSLYIQDGWTFCECNGTAHRAYRYSPHPLPFPADAVMSEAKRQKGGGTFHLHRRSFEEDADIAFEM
ncbi:hypothetical protein BO79DRAFT_218965 [Aspergillus costaricaensis CBS 115574]|uniref:Uncharacterized protein n=1 Tax=Aspergillus costaricaensis CBS 115574 TaxID=1448317 RepID=A0ACD1I9T3_9EURO|nr:hypothetical protein BO79DRAFT_218965 [Aspergillus costaricaensis CBS 115574]RAK87320.1 hypothetical protein BO79DRAFT_218965 [Aspergillus costaricaensis CBS 115574]